MMFSVKTVAELDLEDCNITNQTVEKIVEVIKRRTERVIFYE